MCPSLLLSLAPLYVAPLRKRCGFAAATQLPQTLAFWALWHCRHARPPDMLTA